MDGEEVLALVNRELGTSYRWERRLAGGEQNGAYLIRSDEREMVLKWQLVPWKAQQLLQAYPAISYATDRGWPAARWLHAGPLDHGGAFLLHEYVPGTPLTRLDAAAVRAVIAGNALQAGLAFAGAADDSSQLEAVLGGDSPWKSQVADFTAKGAELVRHGDAVAAWASTSVPVTDVVHGDYSSTNILLDPDGAAVRFVDCETVKRGSRVRDLADLYRQTYVYPGALAEARSLLRAAAAEVEGPQVFARCAVAVTYNNLAWWVENKTRAEFDQACARLHRLFDDVRQG